MVRRKQPSNDASLPKRRAMLLVPRHEVEEKIKAQIQEGQALLNRPPGWSEDELQKLQKDVQSWREYTFTLLQGMFDSDEYAGEFAQFVGGVFYMGMPLGARWQSERDEIAEYVRRLESILRRLPLVQDALTPRASAHSYPASRDVFVVHGHNDAVKQSVARFLEKLDLRPIVLHEQPNKGRTVMEKFEANSDVGFAVVLLTPDDVGGPASPGEKVQPRARQNVILELGYFIGKLSRARVCALHMEGVELPSDLHGVLYLPYDASDGWRLGLAREIKAAGIDVDLNRAV